MSHISNITNCIIPPLYTRDESESRYDHETFDDLLEKNLDEGVNYYLKQKPEVIFDYSPDPIETLDLRQLLSSLYRKLPKISSSESNNLIKLLKKYREIENSKTGPLSPIKVSDDQFQEHLFESDPKCKVFEEIIQQNFEEALNYYLSQPNEFIFSNFVRNIMSNCNLENQLVNFIYQKLPTLDTPTLINLISLLKEYLDVIKYTDQGQDKNLELLLTNLPTNKQDLILVALANYEIQLIRLSKAQATLSKMSHKALIERINKEIKIFQQYYMTK